MPLTPGTRIGSYEISALLGAGGMGEVYRARDSKLKREVAIKVMPELLASDPERLARFQREAELLATLNHPNIAAIYGLEQENTTRAIVLELVEGETLADQIARGPLAVDESLRIARQIIDALETAHDRGVVHRDLKPANIKITPDGKVKVLDFGLAKMLESPAASALGLSMSPTMSIQATYAGVILGTAAYMSPEQARGKQVDRRTDIWAFGCALFEMLTGRQAFDTPGDTVSDAVAAVLMKEPDWSALPPQTPPHIVALIRRCLQKDVQKRVPHIGVARLEIDEGPASLQGQTSAVRAQPWWRHAMPVAAGVILTATVAAVGWWRLRPETRPPIVTRFAFALPEGQLFSNAGRQVIAISPDGTRLVYVANQRLYLRALSELDAQPIPGIDGTYGVLNPVFSPDGNSIAFWTSADRSLKKVATAGGSPITIGAVRPPYGMSWGPDGILLGDLGRGVVRVLPAGGTPELLVSIKPDESAQGPQMLPGGDAVLFTLAKGAAIDRWDKAQIVVHSLRSGERKVLIEGGTDARYLPTGHIVYALSGVVRAVPFDVKRLEVSGGPVPIVEGVRRAPAQATGTAQFSVAADGTLAYVTGPLSTDSGGVQLALIDRKGITEALNAPSAIITHPRLSPDGKRVAFVTDDDKDVVVWTYELSGATAMHRVTFGGKNRYPIWSYDGERIAFQSDREGDLGIFWQRADGTGAVERLTTAEKDTEHVPESWSPKGDGFLFRVTKGRQHTLMFYSPKDRKATPFGGVASAWPTNAVFSPDGRWVAYESGSAGLIDVGAGDQRAVFVQPYPATGSKYQIPVVEQGGYRHPRWSPDGRELFYMIGGSVRLRVAGITTQPGFAFGNSTSLPRPATWQDNNNDPGRQWDVMPDGQHFIVRIPAGSAGQPGQVQTQRIEVVLNWFEELKQRVPTK
jgi:eukaryotic-like serine/threonine-protein kinase